jgi:hypothetical protein
MPVIRTVLGAALVTAGALPAAAQSASAEEDRFFIDKVEEDEDGTLWQGSLTSTSFLHREAAGISQPPLGGTVGIENAAPTRWFTDLRAQIDARHIAGKTWDARVDARARVVNELGSGIGNAATPRPQSGSLSADEYDVRELYLVRGTTSTDLVIGRQTVLDVAGLKIDGARLDYAKSARWTYLGFAGLYPRRGSRSVTTDYPVGIDAMGEPTRRVTPVAAGGGGAYRTATTYGAVGAAGIVPLADDIETGTMEQPRLLVSSNGYWRRSQFLDVYHYAVVDLVGAGGFAVTNGSLGVNYRPQPRLQVHVAAHHVDTETLNVQAQTTLEDPDQRPVGVIQNNVTVQRISADSARVSVSAALGQTMRWEVTAAGAARRRPEITLQANPGGIDQTIPAAQSGEIFFQAVDRTFYGGVRLAGSFVRIFGLGNNAARSTSQIVRLAANREIAEGRGEVEADLSYLASTDENRGLCSVVDLTTCYGSSRIQSLALSSTGFYRLRADWMLMGTLELSRRRLTTLEGDLEVAQPAVLGTTGLLRIAYRF